MGVVPLLLLGLLVALRTEPAPRPGGGPSSPSPLTIADGTPPPERLAVEAPLRLSDGSSVRLHPESEVRLLRNRDGEVAFEVRRGIARFDVTPGRGRRWRVDAGRLRVEVLGTAFTVRRDEAGASVAVHRGRVSATVDGRSHVLVAGERLAVESPRPAPRNDAAEALALPPSPPAAEPPPTVAVLLELAERARSIEARGARVDDGARAAAVEYAARFPRGGRLASIEAIVGDP